MTSNIENNAFDDAANELISDQSKIEKLKVEVRKARNVEKLKDSSQHNRTIFNNLCRITLRRKKFNLKITPSLDPSETPTKNKNAEKCRIIIDGRMREIRFRKNNGKPHSAPPASLVAYWLEYLFHFHPELLENYFKDACDSDVPYEFSNTNELPEFVSLISGSAKQQETDPTDTSAQDHQLPGGIPPLILDTESSNRLFHYSNTKVKVLGRHEEEAILNRFLGKNKNFRWLQLAGAGGQGKSRLAFELMLESQKRHWESGFLLEENFPLDNIDYWELWKPAKPTLIIIDYVLGNEAAIKFALQSLTKVERNFRHPVRMLLVERQRWDRGALEDSKSNKQSVDNIREMKFKPSLGGKTEWFLKLCNRPNGEDKNLDACCFVDKDTKTNGVIELEALLPDQLLEIIKQYAGSTYLEKYDDDMLKAHLKRIDRSGRPLFAYFLAKAIKEEKYQSSWAQDDLLKETIESNQRKRWNPEFVEGPPKLGDNTPATRLATLATMIEGFDTATLSDHEGWSMNDDTDTRQAIMLNDGHLGASGEAQSLIPPLLPDILGEWFVLRSFEKFMKQEMGPIVQLAWKLAPEKMAVFLQRLTQDFPTKNSVQEMLDVHLPDILSASEYQFVSSSIFGILHEAKAAYPPQLLSQLSIAAKDDQNWEAIFMLGYCKLTGDGFEKNEKDGYLLTLKAAQKKSVAAMFNLGHCYQNGNGVKANPKEAVKWYKKAAALDSSIAMFNLGICYHNGTGVKAAPKEAVKWYKKAAALDNSTAMTKLGICYEDGIGVKANPKEAVRWYEKAAALNNSNAMFNLGICYEDGIGVKADPEEAVRWYEKAAALNNSDAMTKLGICYENGIGIKAAPKEAVKWYKKAAALDNSNAMVNFGICYEDGIGVKANPKEAVRWYEKAAVLDNSTAMFNLGNCYREGTSVKAAPKEAVKWYKKAAALDNSDAMVNLGICYEDGIGVKADPEEAVKLYKKAAALDNSTAMVNLGHCYQNGIGVKANKHKAFEWLLKAITTDSNQTREENEFLLACEFGIIETIARKVGTGVNVNCQYPKNLRTGLIFACRSGESRVVKLLLQQPDIDPNIQESSGFTALIIATGYEYLEILRTLILHPETNLDYQVEDGATALSYAAALNKVDSLHLLLEAGANPTIRNLDGDTAAHFALQEAKNQELYDLLKQAEIDWIAKHGPS